MENLLIYWKIQEKCDGHSGKYQRSSQILGIFVRLKENSVYIYRV